MKRISARYNILLAALFFISLLLSAAQTAHAADRINRMSPQFVFGGAHYSLPVIQLGFEAITEGTENYTVTRTMRRLFPFDSDLTVIAAWGYTGDDFTITVTDLGDTGDRIFACVAAVINGQTTTEWGTMYSSSSQTSFDVTVPMEAPGGLIYLLTGFLTPSAGDDQPYSYSISFSFPQ